MAVLQSLGVAKPGLLPYPSIPSCPYMHIYICICICVCAYLSIYLASYISIEREKKREERERGRVCVHEVSGPQDHEGGMDSYRGS